VNQKQADWSIADPKVAGCAVTAPAANTSTAKLVYTFTTATTGVENTYLSAVA
jgi:hypothetical protein